MEKIKIKHQEEKSDYQFMVVDPDKLTPQEVKRICKKMGVVALLINGNYYENK